MRVTSHSLLIVATLLASGCSSEQESINGRWECVTSHPGGFESKDIFDFSSKGTMLLDSDGLVMQGEFEQSGKKLTMNLTYEVQDILGRKVTQHQAFVAKIKKLTEDKLVMDASTGNNHHLSNCRRN